MIEKERWKFIPNTNKLYSLSNLGVVRNNKRNRILKLKKDRDGYVRCNIACENKKNITITISRYVLLLFKPIQNPEKYEAHHKNWVRDDNRLSNLEWLLCLHNQAVKKPSIPIRSLALYKELLKILGDETLANKLKELKGRAA